MNGKAVEAQVSETARLINCLLSFMPLNPCQEPIMHGMSFKGHLVESQQQRAQSKKKIDVARKRCNAGRSIAKTLTSTVWPAKCQCRLQHPITFPFWKGTSIGMFVFSASFETPKKFTSQFQGIHPMQGQRPRGVAYPEA